MAEPPSLPQEDRQRPPLADAKRNPPTGRKFPCRQCGAKLEFDPSERGLKCTYCGFTELIPDADDDEKAKVREIDLEEFLARQEDRADLATTGRWLEAKCDGCGAVVLFEDKVQTEQCPYCTTHIESKPHEAEHLIVPESILPFSITNRDALKAFNTWLDSLWFAPSQLKRLANVGNCSTVYLPYWTFDSMTYTRYTGERGEDYYVTESYTDSSGKSQTRQVRHTRWYNVSGEVQHFFDDILIKGSLSLPRHLVDGLRPWGLSELEPFRAEFLSGHRAERYSVSLTDGFKESKTVMQHELTSMIHADIGGDHQRIHSRHTDHVGVTFKHTLLPIWVAGYRYHDQLYHVLVNGWSGKVAGDRPWSAWKIVRLILFIVMAIVLIVAVVVKLSN